MKKLITPYSLLIAIIIIAAFLRLYNITQVPPGLYPDEAMNGNNALEALENTHFSAEDGPASGWKVFYPENNGREGLFINIQAISIKLFGNEPWALRVVSAIFGILTVLGVYFLSKELFPKNFQFSIFNFQFNEAIALFSSFLLATSFWHINFSRIGFRAIMAPFFLTWALYFLLQSLNSISRTSDVPNIDGDMRTSNVQKLKNSKFYILNSIFSGLLFGLGFHSYIAYRGMPLLILIILLFYWFKISRETDAKQNAKLTRNKFLFIALLFLLSTIIIISPLMLYFLENPGSFFGRTTQVSIFSAEGGSASGGNSLSILKNLSINILKTAGMFNFMGDWNWRHNYAGRPELFWPVGILFLIGVFFGIKSIFRTSDVPNINNNFRTSDVQKLKFGFGILFAWLIIAALPVVVSNEGLPHALRSIIMIPPVFILAGFGGAYLYEVLKKYVPPQHHRIIHYSLFIILILLVFEAYTTYFIRWARNPNVQNAFSADYAWMGYGLRILPKELPKYVIVEAQGVDVRGIPMPAQTVMFLTDTFTPEKQKEKNLFYVLPNQISQIPAGAYVTYIK